MVYNSETNSQDCVSEVLAICGATINTYTINEITRRFNQALDEYFDLAFDSSGQWPFDDVNQTTAAISTQNLVSGTNAYKLSAFTGSAVNVLGVKVYNDAATLCDVTKENFQEADFEEDYVTTSTGVPTHYLLFGNFLYLRPTPSYSETNGLRVYTERNPLYMLPTDTTKEPGVPKKHHLYLCRKTALPYLVDKRLSNKNDIAILIQKDEQDIKSYYATRDKTVVQRLSPFKQDNR